MEKRENPSNFIKRDSSKNKNAPSSAYVMASWLALITGILTYLIGLYNAKMQLNEKGYYFTLLLYGLFAAVSLQKVVRDRDDGLPITNIYYGLCWISLGFAILLMSVGLFNAGSIIRSEKGFYAMTFILSIFSAITVQKNVRDIENSKNQ